MPGLDQGRRSWCSRWLSPLGASSPESKARNNRRVRQRGKASIGKVRSNLSPNNGSKSDLSPRSPSPGGLTTRYA